MALNNNYFWDRNTSIPKTYTWEGKDKGKVTRFTNLYTKNPNFFDLWFAKENKDDIYNYNTLKTDTGANAIGNASYGPNNGKIYRQTNESRDFMNKKWSDPLNNEPIYLTGDPKNEAYDAFLNTYGQLAFYPRSISKIQSNYTPDLAGWQLNQQRRPLQIDQRLQLPTLSSNTMTLSGNADLAKPELPELSGKTFNPYSNVKNTFEFHLYLPSINPATKYVNIEKAVEETNNFNSRGVVSGNNTYTDDIPTNTPGSNTPGTNVPGNNTPGTNNGYFHYRTWRDPNSSYTGLIELDIDKNKLNGSNKYFDWDWNHLYDMAKAGNAIGLAYKNWKIADAAERPILHDPVEHHRAVYGDYFAKTLALNNAALLFNTASRPVTSDIALTQATLLLSLIAANDAINQGNQVDNLKREQTAEIAWQQEKENKNNRHEVAMANRDAIYKADFNRADLKQQRNAYIHKEFENILSAWLKDYLDFRNERKKYQDLYDLEFAVKNGMNSYMAANNTSPEMQRRALEYLYKPKSFNSWYNDPNTTLELKEEILNIIKGGTYTGHENYYRNKGIRVQQSAKGGTLQKEILKKKQKDVDRFAKYVEEGNKRVQKAVFKNIDRMHRPKYQHGGGLVAFNSNIVRTPSETISPPYWFGNLGSTDSKKKDSAGSKVNELLKSSKALDIDRAFIEKSVQQVMALGDSSLDSSGIEAQALQIQSKIKKAELDYDLAVKVSETLQKNGGDKEAYIDTNGLVMVFDQEGGYSKVPVSEALNHDHIVTNTEALQYRNSNPLAAFNSNIIFDLMSGIGMNSIYEKIEEVCKQLGHEDLFYHAIGKIEKGQINMGTGSILAGLYSDVEKKHISLADGLYELKMHNKDNYNELIASINTLFSNLSTQELALISLKAQKSNLKISDYLFGMLAPKRIIEKDYDPDVKSVKDHERKASSKENQIKEMGTPLMMSDILGLSGTKENTNLLIGGDFKNNPGNVGFTAEVHRGTLTINNNRISTDIPLNGTLLLNKSDIKSYSDTSKATFLGEDVADWSKVLLEDSYFYKVMLPVNSDGTPNFSIAEKLKNVIKNLNDAGATNAKGKKISAEDFNNINNSFKSEESKKLLEAALEGLGLNISDISNIRPFLFCYASAGEQAFNQTSDHWYNTSYKTPDIKLKLNDLNTIKYNSIIDKLSKASGLQGKTKYDKDSIGEIYNGAIYIPLRYDSLGSDNTQYPTSTLVAGTDSRNHEIETRDLIPKANTIKSNK